jgi:hypothetical protein
MNAYMLLGLSGFTVAVYLVLSNRLTAILWPLRLHIAELGETLLADPRMPVLHRKRIEHELNYTFSLPRAWLCVFIVPVAAVLAFRDKVLDRNVDPIADVPQDLRPNLRYFCALTVVSTIGNSPLVAVLVLIEVTLCLVTWLPLGTLLRESIKMLDAFDMRLRDRMYNGHGGSIAA